MGSNQFYVPLCSRKSNAFKQKLPIWRVVLYPSNPKATLELNPKIWLWGRKKCVWFCALCYTEKMVTATIFAFKFYKAIDQYLICEQISSLSSASAIKNECLAIRYHSFSHPKYRKGKPTNLLFCLASKHLRNVTVFTDTAILEVYQLTAVWVL